MIFPQQIIYFLGQIIFLNNVKGSNEISKFLAKIHCQKQEKQELNNSTGHCTLTPDHTGGGGKPRFQLYIYVYTIYY